MAYNDPCIECRDADSEVCWQCRMVYEALFIAFNYNGCSVDECLGDIDGVI